METLKLLGFFALHLALTGLPAVAAALLAARLGNRSVPVLLAISLAASGLLAFVTFWAYYWDRTIGETFSFLTAFGSAAAIVWALALGVERPLLHALAAPFLLWALGSAFVLFLGFLHGGADGSLGVAATRFIGLPSDNDVPNFFSEWFYLHGHHGTPPIFPPDWLASDRPPLQVGYVLAQRPFGWDKAGLHYQVLGVLLQQLWIVGLWALLLAARVGRLTRALAMAVVLVSGLAIVNGFFVWPKLLPAALLLAAAALVMTPLWEELRRSLWGAALFAALCGLALLAHGSSVFGVIPLLAIAALRGLPSWRWIGVAALVGVVLIAPWSAYQKYGDPPGNRLTKWTLAGVTEVDDRSTSEAVVDAYGEAGFGGALHNKAENFVTMAGGGPAVETLKNGFDDGSLEGIVMSVRAVTFFNLLPSLGLLLLGLVAMAAGYARGRRGPPEWNFALRCLGVVAIGCLAWGLLEFGSDASRTVIHIGTYLLPILAMAGTVVGLRVVLPRFAIYWVGLQALLSLALYVPSFTPAPETSFSLWAAVIAAASLFGFCVCALGVRDLAMEAPEEGEISPAPAIASPPAAAR
jgi:hypothetical protein